MLTYMLDTNPRSEGLIVVTNNMRGFARMPGVSVENWI
jgi:tRNA(fMet)-specific endonuclease VapC